jgi:hypothetical protein
LLVVDDEPLPDHRPAESVRAGVLDDDGQSCQGSVGG